MPLPWVVRTRRSASLPCGRDKRDHSLGFGPVAGRSSPRNRVTKSHTRRCQRSIPTFPFILPLTGNVRKYTPFPRRFQAGNAVFGNCARGVGVDQRPETRDLGVRHETLRLGRLYRRPRQARPLVVSMSHAPRLVSGLRSHVRAPMPTSPAAGARCHLGGDGRTRPHGGQTGLVATQKVPRREVKPSLGLKNPPILGRSNTPSGGKRSPSYYLKLRGLADTLRPIPCSHLAKTLAQAPPSQNRRCCSCTSSGIYLAAARRISARP